MYYRKFNLKKIFWKASTIFWAALYLPFAKNIDIVPNHLKVLHRQFVNFEKF